MRKKGFTLIELLVVIAIIAMLLAILMPALNKVKRLAQRLVCGTSVKGLGTAMMVYAQDFEDEYPMQGGAGGHRWSNVGRTYEWYNPDKSWDDPPDKFITVAASLYLLVRVADVDPKSFVCRSGDETAFKGVGGTANLDIVELWDFGGETIDTTLPSGGTITYNEGLPGKHVSYAYQLPYAYNTNGPAGRAHPASATASASTAILADKNPWQDPKLTDGQNSDSAQKKTNYMMLVDWLGVPEDTTSGIDWTDPGDPLRDSTTAWQIQIANSQAHGREGQNVLFGDGHCSFEKRPDVSYQNDNIYTMFNNTAGPPSYNEYDRRTGTNRAGNTPAVIPTSAGEIGSFPRTDEDTLLVNDDSRYPPLH